MVRGIASWSKRVGSSTANTRERQGQDGNGREAWKHGEGVLEDKVEKKGVM